MNRGLLAGVALVMVACAQPTPPSDTSSGLATFHENGLVFDYPAAWRPFHYELVSSFSNLIVYLATVDVPDPCTRTANSIACGQTFRLAPNSIVVSVSGRGFPGFNILDGPPPGATALIVGGLPAYVTRLAPANMAPDADTTVQWTIARPGSVDNSYEIRADIKGPDVAEQLHQLDALVSSLQFDPPVVPLEATDAAAERAATRALATMTASDAAWACFPGKAGARQMRVTSFPQGPILAEPQVATCSTRIEPTRLQLWRLTLTVRLPKADPEAGQDLQIVLWVSPDGTPGLQTSGSPEP
jgi:hypothetical protein